MRKSRQAINGNDTLTDIIVKMADGNPGAVGVMTQIVKKGSPIDALGGLSRLDSLGIYGSSIWVGYKDFAGQDLDVFLEGLQTKNEDMLAKIDENLAMEAKYYPRTP